LSGYERYISCASFIASCVSLENGLKFKQKLISKETQEAIKDAQLKLEQAKIEIRNSLIAAKKQQKAEEANIKKVTKKQTRLNKEKEATAKRKKESSTPKEKKTEVKTVVTKDEKGNTVISPVVTGTAPITTNNKSLNTLIEILGEDNSFIQRFKPLVDAYYTAIQEKNKKVLKLIQFKHFFI
jgi:sRNA-binding protein